MLRPRVLLAVDRIDWAFANIARQLCAHLGEEYDFEITTRPRPCEVDLLVEFCWWRLLRARGSVRARRVAVMVYDCVSWLGSRDAFLATCQHADVVGAANARLAAALGVPALVVEDGVDTALFTPAPLPAEFGAMWCGNSAAAHGEIKGLPLIRDACQLAGVPLRVLDLAQGEVLAHRQMPAWYAQGSVYVCASTSEGTPNPVLEAAACGRPIITTDVGIVRQVVNGQSGRIVQRSPEAIAQALHELRSQDLQIMGTAARVAAERQDWRLKMGAWRDLLATALDESGRGSQKLVHLAQPRAGGESGREPVPPVRAPGSKPRVLLISDVRGWAFDQNLRDMAEHLRERFDCEHRYIVDLPWPQDLEWFDAIFTPYHRWPISHMVPWDRMLGSLRASWFKPEAPAQPGAEEFALVNRHRAFHVVTRQNLEELQAHCPGVVYLTNPVNERRFQRLPQRPRGLVASWTGNARHQNPACDDVKGLRSIIQPAVAAAGVGFVMAEYNTCRVAPADMPAFYERGSVALCASLYEGASNSVMEAMAAGQAVISTDCGNIREIRESQIRHLGVSGIQIVPRTVEAFADALRQLRRRPGHAIEMGAANRQEILARWSWDAWAPRYEQFVRRALS